MELTDIMPVEEWKSLAEDIYTRFGFNGTVFDRNNNVITKSEGWANEICPIIKSGDSSIVCASAQQRASKIVKEKKKPVTEECDAGFKKIVIPIFVNDDFVGMVGGCGCISDDSEVEAFYIGKLINKGEKEVQGLLTKVQKISQDRLTEAINYIQERLREILEGEKGQRKIKT